MKIKHYISFLFLLAFSQANAQTFCQTQNYSMNQHLNTLMHSKILSNHSYCINIYMHVIRRTDGNGGQTVSAVNDAFQILNEDYNTHGISFSWNGSIDYIDNTTYYNNPKYGENQTLNIPPTIFSINNHLDGIDIYLYDNTVGGSGKANGVGNSSELFVTGQFWEPPYQPLATSHVISHEMGHVLFLYHTHQSTCEEWVNGENSEFCGDYVTDTPADPGLNFNVQHPDCEWAGNEEDENGDSYNPDEHNIMSYTHPDCMEYVTTGQAQRARNAIEILPFLQQTLVDCCTDDTTLDLYIGDTPIDLGQEPSPSNTGSSRAESPNIWVRNQNDGLVNQESQMLSYSEGNYHYAYVRVRNKSCVASNEGQLKLYWSQLGTAQSWPTHWDGTEPTLGGSLGTHEIPDIAPGESVVLVYMLDLSSHLETQTNSTVNICLLARIEDLEEDPITPYPNSLYNQIKYNNNVAQRNISILNADWIELIAQIPDHLFDTKYIPVWVGNETNETTEAHNIRFYSPVVDHLSPLTKEAEITLKLDDASWAKWVASGQNGKGIENFRQEAQTLLVTSNDASLLGLSFAPGERSSIGIAYNFLADKQSTQNRFNYRVEQTKTEDNSQVGAVTFEIYKKHRTPFDANAGDDQEIDEGQTITISAEQIYEAATYNWYNAEGALIYTGKDLSVTADIAKKYKLEIIADTDGFKVYDEVEVFLKPSIIESISPNPASNTIEVNYKLNSSSSAYLMIIGQHGTSGTSNNYVLDPNVFQTTINLSNYRNGFYTLALICEGKILDVKSLVKQ